MNKTRTITILSPRDPQGYMFARSKKSWFINCCGRFWFCTVNFRHAHNTKAGCITESSNSPFGRHRWIGNFLTLTNRHRWCCRPHARFWINVLQFSTSTRRFSVEMSCYISIAFQDFVRSRVRSVTIDNTEMTFVPGTNITKFEFTSKTQSTLWSSFFTVQVQRNIIFWSFISQCNFIPTTVQITPRSTIFSIPCTTIHVSVKFTGSCSNHKCTAIHGIRIFINSWNGIFVDPWR